MSTFATILKFDLELDCDCNSQLGEAIEYQVEKHVKTLIDTLNKSRAEGSHVFTDIDFGPTDADEHGAQSLYGSPPTRNTKVVNDSKTRPYAHDPKYPPPETVCWSRPIYDDGNFVHNSDSDSSDGNDDLGDDFAAGTFCKYGQLFLDGSSSGDVVQGQLGDCWFLSALSVLGTREELLRRCFWRGDAFKQYGLYVCRFFKNGQAVIVLIDDRLPVRNGTNRLLFARCKDPNELWVPLLEKAYAKLHGSYKSLIGGYSHYALGDLTGYAPECVALRRKLPSGTNGKDENLNRELVLAADEVWRRLLQYQRWGSLMGCNIQTPPSQTATNRAEAHAGGGLISGHAYSLLAVAEVPKQIKQVDSSVVATETMKMLKLRNPWGRGEWQGAFSDESEERQQYDEAIRKAFALAAIAANGHQAYNDGEDVEVDAGDGTFFMLLEDWLANYTNLFVAVPVPMGWQVRRTAGRWTAGQGGHRDTATWIGNPKFRLRLGDLPSTDNTTSLNDDSTGAKKYRHVFIGLYINDPRITLGADYYKDPLYATPLSIDIVTEESFHAPPAARSNIPLASPTNLLGRDCSNACPNSPVGIRQPEYNYGSTQIELCLQTGVDYYVIPSLYKRDMEGSFFLTLYADSIMGSSTGQIQFEKIESLSIENKPKVLGLDFCVNKSLANQQLFDDSRLKPLSMSVTQFAQMKESLRDRLCTEFHRLGIIKSLPDKSVGNPMSTTALIMSAVFGNNESLSPTALKAALLKLGVNLEGLPDNFLLSLDEDNNGVIDSKEVESFLRIGFKRATDELHLQSSGPVEPEDDLIHRAKPERGVFSIRIRQARNLLFPEDECELSSSALAKHSNWKRKPALCYVDKTEMRKRCIEQSSITNISCSQQANIGIPNLMQPMLKNEKLTGGKLSIDQDSGTVGWLGLLCPKTTTRSEDSQNAPLRKGLDIWDELLEAVLDICESRPIQQVLPLSLPMIKDYSRIPSSALALLDSLGMGKDADLSSVCQSKLSSGFVPSRLRPGKAVINSVAQNNKFKSSEVTLGDDLDNNVCDHSELMYLSYRRVVSIQVCYKTEQQLSFLKPPTIEFKGGSSYLNRVERERSLDCTELLINIYLCSTAILILAHEPVQGVRTHLVVRENVYLPFGPALTKLFQRHVDNLALVSKFPMEIQSAIYNSESTLLVNSIDTPSEEEAFAHIVGRLRLVRHQNNTHLVLAEDPHICDEIRQTILNECSQLPLFITVNDFEIRFTLDSGFHPTDVHLSISQQILSIIKSVPALLNVLTAISTSLIVVLEGQCLSLKEYPNNQNTHYNSTMSWTEMQAHLAEKRNPILSIEMAPPNLLPHQYLYRPDNNFCNLAGHANVRDFKQSLPSVDGGANPTWNFSAQMPFQTPTITSCRILGSEIARMKIDDVARYVIVMLRETSLSISDDGVAMPPLRFLTAYDQRSASEYMCGVTNQSDLADALYSQQSTDTSKLCNTSTLLQLLSQAAEEDSLIAGPLLTPQFTISVVSTNASKNAPLIGVAEISLNSILSGFGTGLNEERWINVKRALTDAKAGTRTIIVGEILCAVVYKSCVEIEDEQLSIKCRHSRVRAIMGLSTLKNEKGLQVATTNRAVGPIGESSNNEGKVNFTNEINTTIKERDGGFIESGALTVTSASKSFFEAELEIISPSRQPATVNPDISCQPAAESWSRDTVPQLTRLQLNLVSTNNRQQSIASQPNFVENSVVPNSANDTSGDEINDGVANKRKSNDHINFTRPELVPVDPAAHAALQAEFDMLRNEAEQLRREFNRVSASASSVSLPRSNSSCVDGNISSSSSSGALDINNSTVLLAVTGDIFVRKLSQLLIARRKARIRRPCTSSSQPLETLARVLSTYARGPEQRLTRSDFKDALADIAIDTTHEQISTLVNHMSEGPADTTTKLPSIDVDGQKILTLEVILKFLRVQISLLLSTKQNLVAASKPAWSDTWNRPAVSTPVLSSPSRVSNDNRLFTKRRKQDLETCNDDYDCAHNDGKNDDSQVSESQPKVDKPAIRSRFQNSSESLPRSALVEPTPMPLRSRPLCSPQSPSASPIPSTLRIQVPLSGRGMKQSARFGDEKETDDLHWSSNTHRESSSSMDNNFNVFSPPKPTSGRPLKSSKSNDIGSDVDKRPTVVERLQLSPCSKSLLPISRSNQGTPQVKSKNQSQGQRQGEIATENNSRPTSADATVANGCRGKSRNRPSSADMPASNGRISSGECRSRNRNTTVSNRDHESSRSQDKAGSWPRSQDRNESLHEEEISSQGQEEIRPQGQACCLGSAAATLPSRRTTRSQPPTSGTLKFTSQVVGAHSELETIDSTLDMPIDEYESSFGITHDATIRGLVDISSTTLRTTTETMASSLYQHQPSNIDGNGEDETWQLAYEALLLYYSEMGDCNIDSESRNMYDCILPGRGVGGEDLRWRGDMGKWLKEQKSQRANGLLPAVREELLQNLVDDGALTWKDPKELLCLNKSNDLVNSGSEMASRTSLISPIPAVGTIDANLDQMLATVNPKNSTAQDATTDWDNAPLPHGWERRIDSNSRKTYYVDHVNKSTQWKHPLHPAAKSKS